MEHIPHRQRHDDSGPPRHKALTATQAPPRRQSAVLGIPPPSRPAGPLIPRPSQPLPQTSRLIAHGRNPAASAPPPAPLRRPPLRADPHVAGIEAALRDRNSMGRDPAPATGRTSSAKSATTNPAALLSSTSSGRKRPAAEADLSARAQVGGGNDENVDPRRRRIAPSPIAGGRDLSHAVPRVSTSASARVSMDEYDQQFAKPRPVHSTAPTAPTGHSASRLEHTDNTAPRDRIPLPSRSSASHTAPTPLSQRPTQPAESAAANLAMFRQCKFMFDPSHESDALKRLAEILGAKVSTFLDNTVSHVVSRSMVDAYTYPSKLTFSREAAATRPTAAAADPRARFDKLIQKEKVAAATPSSAGRPKQPGVVFDTESYLRHYHLIVEDVTQVHKPHVFKLFGKKDQPLPEGTIPELNFDLAISRKSKNGIMPSPFEWIPEDQRRGASEEEAEEGLTQVAEVADQSDRDARAAGNAPLDGDAPDVAAANECNGGFNAALPRGPALLGSGASVGRASIASGFATQSLVAPPAATTDDCRHPVLGTGFAARPRVDSLQMRVVKEQFGAKVASAETSSKYFLKDDKAKIAAVGEVDSRDPPPMTEKEHSWYYSRHLIDSKRYLEKNGQCENCNEAYDNYGKHIRSKNHRTFTEDEGHFREMDAFLKTVERPTLGLDWFLVRGRREAALRKEEKLDKPKDAPTKDVDVFREDLLRPPSTGMDVTTEEVVVIPQDAAAMLADDPRSTSVVPPTEEAAPEDSAEDLSTTLDANVETAGALKEASQTHGCGDEEDEEVAPAEFVPIVAEQEAEWTEVLREVAEADERENVGDDWDMLSRLQTGEFAHDGKDEALEEVAPTNAAARSCVPSDFIDPEPEPLKRVAWTPPLPSTEPPGARIGQFRSRASRQDTWQVRAISYAENVAPAVAAEPGETREPIAAETHAAQRTVHGAEADERLTRLMLAVPEVESWSDAENRRCGEQRHQRTSSPSAAGTFPSGDMVPSEGRSIRTPGTPKQQRSPRPHKDGSRVQSLPQVPTNKRLTTRFCGSAFVLAVVIAPGVIAIVIAIGIVITVLIVTVLIFFIVLIVLTVALIVVLIVLVIVVARVEDAEGMKKRPACTGGITVIVSVAAAVAPVDDPAVTGAAGAVQADDDCINPLPFLFPPSLEDFSAKAEK
ncbi:hypothetical protein DFJ73DRAFT_780481 [Zopfochytrium polystomum]|nr:hypothetical protein DFJ73DRAFT_780481 [Zopfochytrium polystomum]